jgi:hypothetical protein
MSLNKHKMKLTKKAVEFMLTKLAIIVMALIFLIVMIVIIIKIKGQGVTILDSIRNLFIFGK